MSTSDNNLSIEELKSQLEELKVSHGPQSEEVGTCLYQLGLAYIRQANAMDAMSYLGDALYVRRQHYPEESLRIREIYYALEQCTFM